ncbi:P-type conjugative transfer ATPase TrbB [Azohydromonas lata]|uniref:P-type conjugative transfer ATPase TrbB n=1 Tax=Azohydromonas lata TaxID=45677 RepID=A0ABU5IK64_9BURK|nr:P-type conjugative transfer ATPase TrbB [Azohydromonas lata]MDZ5459293.1 P-type conjugative transfer ATPase TrbB [Azohydromonas lata]
MDQEVVSVESRAKQKLERDMGPELLRALNDPLTNELMLNPDGTLWLERQGEPMRQIGTMAAHRAQAILEIVAGIYRKEVTKGTPLLECEWPLGNARFAGQLPPIVPRPSFQIRRHTVVVIPLEDYVAKGIMTQAQFDVIVEAVRRRRNILISGGTGSGKTTLANAILGKRVLIFPGDRLIIIEDTGEIRCTAKNYAQWHTTSTTSLRDLIKHALRARPDSIIVGETRGADALDLCMAWNTGHEGGMATIHANNQFAALSRLKLLISMHPESPRPIEPVIAEAVHLIVQIAKTPEGRRVQGILEVSGFRDGDYITKSL